MVFQFHELRIICMHSLFHLKREAKKNDETQFACTEKTNIYRKNWIPIDSQFEQINRTRKEKHDNFIQWCER